MLYKNREKGVLCELTVTDSELDLRMTSRVVGGCRGWQQSTTTSAGKIACWQIASERDHGADHVVVNNSQQRVSAKQIGY
jgi:hypothetical protein